MVVIPRLAMSSFLPRRSLLSLCVLAVLAGIAVGPAWAQDPTREPPQDPRRGGERAERTRGQDGSLADSVRRFERSRGDRVLSAERMQADGRDVNRIKAMDDRGRVRVFVDDPHQQRGQPPRAQRPRGDDD